MRKVNVVSIPSSVSSTFPFSWAATRGSASPIVCRSAGRGIHKTAVHSPHARARPGATGAPQCWRASQQQRQRAGRASRRSHRPSADADEVRSPAADDRGDRAARRRGRARPGRGCGRDRGRGAGCTGSALDPRTSRHRADDRAGAAGRRAIAARATCRRCRAHADIEPSRSSRSPRRSGAPSRKTDPTSTTPPRRRSAACAASSARVAASWPSGCGRSPAIQRSRAPSGRLRDRARRAAGAGGQGVGARRVPGSSTTRPARARRCSSSRSRPSTTRTGSARPRSPSARRSRGSSATSRRSSPAGGPLIALVDAAAELDLVIACGTLSRGWRGALVTPTRRRAARRATRCSSRARRCRSTSSSADCGRS